ncbi:MAG: O-antigen ligase family protein [Chitinophagaceae bacterium]|nr:O-antigen ligase family protein [Chitinophagaceae bacterium]
MIALIYTRNIHEGWNDIRIKSGLVIIPLAVYCSTCITKTLRDKLLSYYCLIVFAASLYCLGKAVITYYHTGSTSSFFYHDLVSPLKQHAVYYSILVFVAFIFLLDSFSKRIKHYGKYLHVFLIIFFSALLFLLSSKLVLVFYTLFMLYYIFRLAKKKPANKSWIVALFITLMAVSWLTLSTANPVSRRFSDIIKGDISVINNEEFSARTYFNGLQFRLLQWKFTAEILNETNSWLIGVSPGDARHFLDQKYVSSKMYTGDPSKGDKGYLLYNTHNQFLETLLQTGIAGLAVLCFLCISLIMIGRAKKRLILSSVILLLLTWLFTESVLETQYGIMIFTFFPLFLAKD